MANRKSLGKNVEITKIWDEHFLYDKDFENKHIDISIKGWFAEIVIWFFNLE